MKKLTRYISLSLLLCLTLLVLCSCAYIGYRGEYAGAYTLVYTQVPATRGATQEMVIFRDPQIILLETDSMGRGLYLYLEDTLGPLSLVIVQREEGDEVYFYPEASAMSFRTPDRIYDIYDTELSEEELISLYRELCSDAVLTSFKADNDWDMPIDESRLDSAKISRPTLTSPWSYRTGKVATPFLEWRDILLGEAVENGHSVPEYFLNGSHGMNIYDSYMATDRYGRELHYIESYYYVFSEEGVYPQATTEYYLEMLAIINPDGSFDRDSFIIELSDICDPDDEMRILKERCGWNQPLYREVER